VQGALAKDLDTAAQDAESGSFACGEAQYKSGDYADTQTTMNTFVTTYPKDPNIALAGKFVIAAQIAAQEPAAGKQVPTLASSGSVTVTITNDSPEAIQVLYTGPATGTVSLAACTACRVYSSEQDGKLNACSDTGITYPQTTITVPPGTMYFLHQPTGGLGGAAKVLTENAADGDSYTDCAFQSSIFGSLNPLTPISPIAPIIPIPPITPGIGL
jgi:hypothetical protein